MSDILGSGLAFPPAGRPARRARARRAARTTSTQAIALILGTAPGERPMRPEFGCAVHDFVFDTIDAAMIGSMETPIRGALDRWEPRIDVDRHRLRPVRRRRRGPPARSTSATASARRTTSATSSIRST